MATHILIVCLAALLGAGVISLVLTGLVRRWARKRDFVDRPGGHKGHDQPVALGGGLAVTLSVILPMLAAALLARAWAQSPPAWLPISLAEHLSGVVAQTPVALMLVGAAGVLCLMGLIDDARPMPPLPKFLIQIAVAAVLVIGFDLRLLSHMHPAISIGLSMLWIITLTNSLNFLDNMDGLTAGVAAIAALIFAATAAMAGQLFVPACCCLLAGALLGFLPYNYNPASIYLGDAGSLVVGMLLAVFTILITFADPAQGRQPFGVLAPLVVMAVPLYDTASVMWIRWRSGDPLWRGDRRHFSHRLLKRGMGVRQAVGAIWLATLATALPSLWLPRVDWTIACGIGVQTLLIVGLVAIMESSKQSS